MIETKSKTSLRSIIVAARRESDLDLVAVALRGLRMWLALDDIIPDDAYAWITACINQLRTRGYKLRGSLHFDREDGEFTIDRESFKMFDLLNQMNGHDTTEA